MVRAAPGELLDPERASRLAEARTADGRTGAQLDHDILGAIAWREDLYVSGPPLAEVESRFAVNDFYHVEIFVSLAGKRDALVEERAAREAGFEGAGVIGNFMRSLIQYHNDTLLVSIR